MESTEQTQNKIQIGAKVEPDLLAILEQMRVKQDRSMSNMIERLLKTHPQIQPILDAQAAEASA